MKKRALLLMFFVSVAGLLLFGSCNLDAPGVTNPAVTTEVRSRAACDGVPAWNATTIYSESGTQVQYNGVLYRNRWWSYGQNPEENSGPWEVWESLGTCSGGGDPTPPPSGDGNITVRARGTSGVEQIRLQVNGSTVTTWTVSTSYQNYSADAGSGTIRVVFINDSGGRDVQVDYIIINGTVYQSEDQATNTAAWQNNQCGGSYSEWLQCNGYIEYTSGGGTTSTPAPTPTPTSSTPTPPATTPPSGGMGAVEFSRQLGVGWNAGNSLDAIGGETAWGNPLLNQTLFNSVKAAGFDTVRLPVAWSQFSDSSNFVISSTWMNRVEEVVDMALNAGLYVIINEHWDNGWMQPTYSQEAYVNNRLSIMWEQIADNFRNYDHRLLFAGTNEVMVEGDYGTPTYEYYTVQNGFNQTFVDTVRAIGGNNSDRYLIVQGFNTNIDHAVNFAVVPDDPADDRLMMEIHYYDPYNFTLNTSSNITQWGAIATDPSRVETWADEAWCDSQFQKMESIFVNQGIAVILGEYGVVSRFSVSDHEIYREYWNEYITQSAVDHDMVPLYWDNGYSGDGGMALFDRNNGSQLYPDIIDAIVSAH